MLEIGLVDFGFIRLFYLKNWSFQRLDPKRLSGQLMYVKVAVSLVFHKTYVMRRIFLIGVKLIEDHVLLAESFKQRLEVWRVHIYLSYFL